MKKKNNTLGCFVCLFALLFAFGTTEGQGFELQFPHGVGAPNSATTKTIIETQDGNLLVLTDYQGYNGDVLLKLDQAGNTIWIEDLSSNANLRGVDLVELSDGTIVIAGDVTVNSSPDFTAFYWQFRDADGLFLSEHSYHAGTSDNVCAAAALSPIGEIVFTGYHEHPVFGNELVFFASDIDGNVTWNNYLAGNYGLEGVDVAFKNDGTGMIGFNNVPNSTMGILTFQPQGNILFFNASTFTQGLMTDLEVATGDSIYLGYTSNGSDHILAKLDNGYEFQWSTNAIGMYGPLITPEIAATIDGGCIVSGYTVGQFLYLFKYNSDGELDWSKTWIDQPFNSGGQAYDVIQTSDGGYALTGELFNFNNFVIKYDGTGNSNLHLVVGQIWMDINGNCNLDSPGDQVAAGWQIKFAGEDTVVVGLNSSTGEFSALLDTGTYAVSVLIGPNPLVEFQPCAPLPVLQLINIGDTTDLGSLLFQPVQNAMISGTVYFDLNQDSHHDPGEPAMPCADLRITSTSPFLDTIVQTDANGLYSLAVSKFVNYRITGLTVFPNCIFSQNFHLVFVDDDVKVEDIGIGCWNFGYLPGIVKGHIDFDLDSDCLPDANANVGTGWYVAFHPPGGGFAQAFPDADGNYSVSLAPGTYDVTVMTSAGAWQVCSGQQSVTIMDNTCIAADLVVQLPNCPLPTVDVVSSVFRPCFTSQISVNYCNLGTDPALNAQVRLVLDPALNFINASQPVASQMGDTLWFDIGTLDPIECGTIYLQAHVDCDAIVGQTHCIEAHIFPDTLCVQASSNWDGSNIELSSRCENNTVTFTIKNTGLGDMASPIPYLVIEDNVLLRPNEIMSFQLLAGSDTSVVFPVQGQTLRLETHQPDGHPYGKKSAIWEEGCGANPANNFSRGFVTQYPYGDEEDFISVFCDESVGSYDPNIKKPFPKGVGPQHFIESTTELDYQILFQNTGTAPAFTVVLRDTLSPLLDPSSLRSGAASHPYSFVLENGNVAVFTFDNINLPDSASNPDGSIGFVKFHIAQAAGNLPGDVIENDAAIYFDFNAPIMTPTVVHRIPLPAYTQTNALSICYGESWQGDIYTADATLADTIHYTFFDSIFITEITVLPLANAVISETLCNGESIVVNGTQYDASHTVGTELFTASNGCDSVVQVSLDFLPSIASEYSPTLCEGESLTIGGTVFNETNTIGNVVFSAANGCDSTVAVSLNFFPAVQVDFQPLLCAGESVQVGNTIYNELNPFGTELFTAANGCDSVVHVSLNFLPELGSTLAETLCAGESLTINGTVYDELNPTGSELFMASNGCDSVVQVTLSFLEPISTELNATLCFGGSLLINGTVYDEDHPTGEEEYTAINGCDSIVSISLSFGNQAIGQLEQVLCPGESIVINGTVYNEGNPIGSELFPNGSYLNCDSLVLISLSFYPTAESEIVGPICEDESITVNGNLYYWGNETGVEVLPNATMTGCDSTIYIDLEILFNQFAAFDTTFLVGEIWNGIQFWNDSTFTQVFPLSNGCDSIVDVTVNILVNGVGDNSQYQQQVKVYPVPVKDDIANLEIEMPQACLASLYLIDGVGRQLRLFYKNEFIGGGKSNMLLNLEGIYPGIYHLVFESPMCRSVLKLVKL